MKGLWLGILIGSCLTTAMGWAADYLYPNETQAILGEIRTREALESIQMQRQNYLDRQVDEAGKVPCR